MLSRGGGGVLEWGGGEEGDLGRGGGGESVQVTRVLSNWVSMFSIYQEDWKSRLRGEKV